MVVQFKLLLDTVYIDFNKVFGTSKVWDFFEIFFFLTSSKMN